VVIKYRFDDGITSFDVENQAIADDYAYKNNISYTIINVEILPTIFPVSQILVYDALQMAKVNPNDRVARILEAHSFIVPYLDINQTLVDLNTCRVLKLHKIKEQVLYLLPYTDRVAKDQLTSLDGNLTRLNDDYTAKLRAITGVAQTALASLNT